MNAPAYVEPAAARAMGGLRLVLGCGVPGPWSVAARAIFDFKGISYVAVPHDAGQDNEVIVSWTGQNSAPVAIWENERPRAHWSELLLLAERLRPDPPLIPADEEERALMFGLSHEICGEDGLGWTLRCLFFAAQRAAGDIPYPTLLEKYHSTHSVEHHRLRLNAILAMLEKRLAAQKMRSSDYLVGHAVSAADFYWAAFSNLIEPMSDAQCEMPAFYRGLGKISRGHLDMPLSKSLLVHRDQVLDRHVFLPISL